MYDTIIHPTDGSACADQALEHAIELATMYDASLHLVYVVREPVTAPSPSLGTIISELEETGQEILDSRRATVEDAGVESVTTHVLDGSIEAELEALIAETGADLVVMGTHGRSGLNRYLVGSVAERVLRTSSVSVLAVGPDESDD
ncbi:Nucleotide-binding universal stress protein, UspA family [Haloplanus vescus]|uniref:Nucleotide-binding universal stress protein, UspA family n=1 Tax=Haloplanus vescus TaxID=555874 RepID=A0A1H3VMW8_9EURY|nr:universal stress protein [Haloplanus vescus]SDZ76147.1 Nucleotide-binding universal stress protein, UspA family [Haloplanus vescus]